MELTIKLRRDSAQNWTTINPVLHEGEAGIELETKKMKLGDGVTVWNSLPYVNVIPNEDITGATHTKITYDSKGLVTGGEDLSASDIPNLTLSKISDVTATAAEVNVLDGITSTTTELNQIHESNVVTSDLTKLHNITADASELNILDGATLTTTELNYVDGATSNIQTQLDNKQPTGNYVTTDTEQEITATKTFTTQQRIQSGQADGCLIVGADSGATTLTNGVRKLGRLGFPTNEDITLNCAFVSCDTQAATSGQVIQNCAEFGGRAGDKTSTSPDVINFTVATEHNTLDSAKKKLVLSIDKNSANFTVEPKYNSNNLITMQDITGAASTVTTSNLTPLRLLISDANGKIIASSNITATEASYLDGVTSSIQTQLDGKQPTITGAATSIVSSNLTASRVLVSNASGKVAADANITTTELGYLDGVTSNIQTQLNNKVNVKPDGTNDLITNNKVADTYLPDYLFGQMIYAGGFVPSTALATLTTNAKKKLGIQSDTITLTNDTTPITGYVANEGCYYICTADGTFAGISLLTGDWLVSTGSAWTKVDNTDAVTGVKGNAETTYRLGNVNITIDNVAPDQTNNSGKVLTTNGTNASWTNIPVEDVQINSTSIVTNGVANIPIAGATTLGTIKCGGYGLQMTDAGVIQLVPAPDSVIVAKSSGYNPLTPNKIDLIVKSGLVNNTQVMSASDKQSATDWILPSQTDNNGKVLRTDGTNASWGYSAIIREWQD